jgi:NAD(P)-dependent dehydrogenase (short-subunit alcohol dehydrogenase family)
MTELEGKFAIITGAGSGMARASTRVFVREGARVLAADISGRQEETAAELGDAVVPFHCDVTKEGQVEAMFAAALDAFGRIDSVLNVAGIGSAGELAEVSMEEYDRIMDADLRSVMLGTKHGIRTMLPTGGGVVLNWSSTGGMNATPFPVSVYSAAKAGAIALTKAAAVEYGPKGIRAIAICPGFIETEMSGGPGAAARHPQLVQGTALKAGWTARGSGRVGVVPVLGSCELHHRCRDPCRRWDDRDTGLKNSQRPASGSNRIYRIRHLVLSLRALSQVAKRVARTCE